MLASPLSLPNWPSGYTTSSSWGSLAEGDLQTDNLWQGLQEDEFLGDMSCPPLPDSATLEQGSSPDNDSPHPYVPTFSVQHPPVPNPATPMSAQLHMAPPVSVPVNSTCPSTAPGDVVLPILDAPPMTAAGSSGDRLCGVAGVGGGAAGSGRPRTYRRRTSSCRSSEGEPGDVSARVCDVCGEQASGHYFGALVCLPCKSFFIRCTKGGGPAFSSQCGGKCDVQKTGRIRCQFCRFQRCLAAGMYRKEKPEAVIPAEGQMLCKVCNDIANGIHFGVTTCEGCKKFFRRGLKEHQAYTCKADMMCTVNPRMRNNCRYCRYRKCLRVGMSRDAIKMGRPKKADSASACRPERPLSSSSRRKYSGSYTYRPGSGAERLHSDAGSNAGVEKGSGPHPLEHHFSVEPVYDIADEFLKAVSMHIDDQQCGDIKVEPAVALVQAAAAVTSGAAGGGGGGGGGGGASASAGTPKTGTPSVDPWDTNVCGNVRSSPDATVVPPTTSCQQATHPSLTRCAGQTHLVPFQQVPYPQSQQRPHFQAPGSWPGEDSNKNRQGAPKRSESFNSVSTLTCSPPKQSLRASGEDLLPSDSRNDTPSSGGYGVTNCCTSPVSPASSPVLQDGIAEQASSRTSSASRVKNGSDFVPTSGAFPFPPQRAPASHHHPCFASAQQQQHQQQNYKDAFHRLNSKGRTFSVSPHSLGYAHSSPESKADRRNSRSSLFKYDDEKQGTTFSSDDLFELLETLGETGHKSSRACPGASPCDQGKMLYSLASANSGRVTGFRTSGLLAQNAGVKFVKANHSVLSSNPKGAGESRRRVSDSVLDYPVEAKYQRLNQHVQNVGQAGMRSENCSVPAFPFAPFFRPECFSRRMQSSACDSSRKVAAGPPLPMSAPVFGSGTGNFHREEWPENSEYNSLHRSHDNIFAAANCSGDLPFTFRPPSGPVFAPDVIGSSPVFPSLVIKQEKGEPVHPHYTTAQRCFYPVGNQPATSRGSSVSSQCAACYEGVNDSPAFSCSICNEREQSSRNDMHQDNTMGDVSRTMARSLANVGSVTKSPVLTASSAAASDTATASQSQSSQGGLSTAASSVACKMVSSSSPSVSLPMSLPTPPGLSAALCACKFPSVSVNRAGLMEVNCYFLTVDKTCEKNDCRGETEYDPSLENSVASCRCLKCQENHTRESSVWRKFCMKRAHRYWHKHVPSPLVVHMTVRNQQTLTTVARALGHLQAAINDLDRDCAAGHSTSDDCHADPVERLYHQGVGITRIVRHFLQLIPGARQLGQDVEMLVQGAGFGTAVILVGSQGFDAECRRFRQIWTWTVPTSSPLFSFKVNLLTLAGRVHGIALDKMETALLCAICLLSTDVDGLQNPEAVEDARRVLLDGLEAYISSRDQWPSVRVKRLFSIMPEIRLVTAWHSGLLASIRPREQPQANASPNPVTSL